MVESGRFGAVIWRAVPCTNEGKHVSLAKGYQKGFNERYFRPFPGFPYFFSPFAGTSQEQTSQASACTARTCSFTEEKWGKSLVPPAAAVWKMSYKDVGVVTGLCFAVKNATVICDWRCTICRIKAVFIKVMSLRRLAIREILSIPPSTQENSNWKVIG